MLSLLFLKSKGGNLHVQMTFGFGNVTKAGEVSLSRFGAMVYFNSSLFDYSIKRIGNDHIRAEELFEERRELLEEACF